MTWGTLRAVEKKPQDLSFIMVTVRVVTFITTTQCPTNNSSWHSRVPHWGLRKVLIT